MPPKTLEHILETTFSGIDRTRSTFSPQLTLREAGIVTTVSAGIAQVEGLPGVGFDELVRFPGDWYGIAFDLNEKEIGVVLLGENSRLHAGDEVERTGRVMDVPVGNALIGRVVDPLARPLDEKARSQQVAGYRLSAMRRPLWTELPSLCHCKPVSR